MADSERAAVLVRLRRETIRRRAAIIVLDAATHRQTEAMLDARSIDPPVSLRVLAEAIGTSEQNVAKRLRRASDDHDDQR